jgi:hypothetical protein
MVKLVFNAYGYTYQNGIRVLIQSYRSAEQALSLDVERIADEAIEHQKAVARGEEEFIGERDDEGNIIWSRQRELNTQYDLAEDALRTLRRAYAIAAYHQWERGARQWTKAPKSDDHDKLVKRVEALGLTVDPHVHLLRMVVNLLKHNNDTWGERVRQAEPSLLQKPESRSLFSHSADWFEALNITGTWMTTFFNAVARSGPTLLTVFK